MSALRTMKQWLGLPMLRGELLRVGPLSLCALAPEPSNPSYIGSGNDGSEEHGTEAGGIRL